MENRKKIINTSLLPPCTILILFILTSFIYKDLDIRLIYGYGAMALFIGVFCAYKKANNIDVIENFTVFENLYLILPGIVLFNVCRIDATKDYEVFAYVMAMMVATSFVVFTNLESEEYKGIFKYILFFAWCLVAFELLNYISPGFQEFYLSHISEVSRAYNNHMLSKGYFVSIGSSLTFVDYIMFMGVSVYVIKYVTTKDTMHLIKTIPMFFIMVLIGRRGELLAAVLAVLIFKILKDDSETRKKHFKIGLKIIILGILAVELLMPILKQSNVLYRYILTLERMKSGQDITSGRIELWTMALNAFKEKPIFGIGWRNFMFCIPDAFRAQHGAAVYGERGIYNAHNIYVHILCETGLIGAIIIIGTLIAILIVTMKLFIKIYSEKTFTGEKNNKALNLISFSVFMQSYFLLLGVLDPVFYNRIFWLIYALAIKFAAEAKKLNDKVQEETSELIMDEI